VRQRDFEAANIAMGEGANGKGLTKERPIHVEQLYDAAKRFFANAASAAAFESPELGASFGKASTHWLRHTFGSHGVANGMALETVRVFLGHTSLATTSIYSTAELSRQYKEVDAFLAETFDG
jgi:integrase